VKSSAEQRLKLEKIETVLTDCIKEIKSGKATLAECLERYPSQRHELEPLLILALNIQEPPAFTLDPTYKRSAKDQLLRQIRTSKPANSRSWTDIFSFGLPRQQVWARFAVAVVIGVIVISVLGGSTAYASQSSVPGDVLYPVKTQTEEVRLWMAGDSADKTDLNLDFARTRLFELSQLAIRNSDKIEMAVKGYRDNLKAAESNTQSITDSAVLARVLERYALKLGEQITFCDNLIDIYSVDNTAIQEASALAIDQQIINLTGLAQQNILLAAQVNFNMMQNRLQRAQVKAGERQYAAMRPAILQYQKFNHLGEQILQGAHNTQNQALEIDKLSATALQSYLETLDSISQQVPREYQNTLKAAQAMTAQFQEQARHGYQYRGESDGGPNRGPDTVPSVEDNNNTTQESPTTTTQSQAGLESTGNMPANTPTPTQGAGGNSGEGSGAGGGPGSGSGSASQPNTSPDTGGNTGNGSGTGSGSGSESDPGAGSGTGSGSGTESGTGSGATSPSGNTSGSSGGSGQN
jgi:hypothetical protein